MLGAVQGKKINLKTSPVSRTPVLQATTKEPTGWDRIRKSLIS